MTVRIVFALLMMVFVVSTHAQSARKKTNIDKGWKFALGHAANAEKDFNYSISTIFSKSGAAPGTAINPGFNDSTWRNIDLPHDWAVELPFVNVDNFDVQSHGYKPVGGLFPATSIGWYRKYFTVPAADSGKRFELQFDGIYRDANIWVNGFYLGNNKSGYVAENYDITDVIHFHKPNVIVVRADATQYEGWFYEGAGIYRHVWLNEYEQTHINTHGIFAYSSIKGNNATVTVETSISNETAASGEYSVRSFLNTRDGKRVANSREEKITIGAGAAAQIKQSLTISNPLMWDLDNPYLYRVGVELLRNGKMIDAQQIKFGIRNIEIKPNGLFLNGKHLKILGTNNHQDHAGLGSALPDYLQYYRINLLKNMGSNAYRTSHNAPTPELLDACDSLGMLVMSEQRLLNSGAESMNQFERLVIRDRSRASIFMWSIGNEEGWIHTNSYGKRIAQTFINKLKLLDPTRTCTYAADVPNVYNGVNEVIPVRSFNYRQFAVADYNKDHPTQPIIGTEMGSTVTTRGEVRTDSVRAYLPDQDITAPWWASTAETWWKLAAPNDYWLGGFIWTGFDYRGEPTPFKWPNINSHFGVMDVCGFPKNIYYYYQSWWTDKDVLHISPHWNHEVVWGQPAPVIDVWVNSNADNVELFLNGKSLGKKDMPRNGHLQWPVSYERGRLEAVAYKKGKKLTAKVETTGTPTEVVMTPYKTTMMADGSDVTVVNISVVDREGREVPDADNMIRFELEGDATIIGVGNGDPSSHEPDKCAAGAWQRRLFNGKCQVIIQSGTKPGIIHFDAKAAGLYKGSTDIITVSPASAATITIDTIYQLKGEAAKPQKVDQMIGADISYLPELEAKGIQFSDKGVKKDAIEILQSHGFNYVRLRLFHNPSLDSGYSPGKGFCDLANTLAMAKRVKASGMKLLLDFHYSDYWADPGKQYKPAAWKNLNFTDLKKALYDYTREVMLALKAQGTLPDMVQVGNEINHGIVWPDGNVANIDGTAQLINAGTAAVKSVHPTVQLMLHLALGGQNHESVFFIDNMVARGVPFDVIGQSFYPKWHGTLSDLENNLNDLSRRYNKDVIVVEYSALKKEVNKIAFEVAGGRGKGTCIWEPLSTWEAIFDRDGKSNGYLAEYDELSKQFLVK
jgi:beta-galactosidase